MTYSRDLNAQRDSASFSGPYTSSSRDRTGDSIGAIPEHLLYERMDPAGFWVRFFALMMDGLILALLMNAINAVALSLLRSTLSFEIYSALIRRIRHEGSPVLNGGEALTETAIAIFVTWVVLIFGSYFLYGAIFESSKWQATPGKRAFGIVVTTTNDYRCSFLRTLVRSVLKFISALPFYFGYLLCLMSFERLTLHDILSGTRVRETYCRSSGARWLLGFVVLATPVILFWIDPRLIDCTYDGTTATSMGWHVSTSR